MIKGMKIIVIFAIIALTLFFGRSMKSSSGVQVDEIFLNARSLGISQYNDFFAPKESIDKSNSTAMYDDRITSASELKNTSSFIYEIALVSRIQYGVMVESKVKITRVIKDSANIHKTEDMIYIFERCFSLGITSITAESPILPMKLGQKYVVFLNEIQSYINHERFNLSTLMYSIIPVKQNLSVVSVSDEKHEELNLSEKTKGLDYQYTTNFDLVHFLLNTLDLNEVKRQSGNDLASYLAQYGKDANVENVNSIKERLNNAKYSLAYFENYKEICKDILKEYYNFDIVFKEVSYGE